MFSEIESFVSLLERGVNYFKKKKKSQVTNEQLVSTRLIKAFQAHGVHRNQMPRVLGFGLTLSDVKSDECLLEKLNEEMIGSACKMLGISRDWLDGVSKEVYETYSFYKHPKEFEAFLLQLLERAGSEKISGVLLAGSKKDGTTEAVLLLQETIGSINYNEYYRYYLCTDWVFSYWKSRAYLTACVAICWKNSVFVHGKYADANFLSSISKGESLLNLGSDGMYSIEGEAWYAEDLALSPEVYLAGVDPEVNKFGIISALSLWLELDKHGFLSCGLSDVSARNRFEYELKKLS